MKILVIHSGGTIGMVQTAHGFAPQVGIVEDCIRDLVRDGRIAAECEVLVAEPLIDSANASPEDWNWISGQIHRKYEDFDAFVVTHGTDTLAFTAAALCFALEGLTKPVILTGSMLPLTVQGNDGLVNLVDAFAAAQHADAGVWVQFAGTLLHGARVRKSHSTSFDAFHASPSSDKPRRPAENLVRHAYGSFDVPVLAVAPGMSGNLLFTAAQMAQGIILRCYGSGTLPATDMVSKSLHEARRRCVPVVAVSQCAEGGISLGQYAAGALLHESGAIDGRDITVEAAYAKLLHVLSLGLDFENQRRMLKTAICGEHSR